VDLASLSFVSLRVYEGLIQLDCGQTLLPEGETWQRTILQGFGGAYGLVTTSLGEAGSTNFTPFAWLAFSVAGRSSAASWIFRFQYPSVQ
jgi:hypothetical protein